MISKVNLLKIDWVTKKKRGGTLRIGITIPTDWVRDVEPFFLPQKWKTSSKEGGWGSGAAT
jgi:hypothetical protein